MPRVDWLGGQDITTSGSPVFGANCERPELSASWGSTPSDRTEKYSPKGKLPHHLATGKAILVKELAYAGNLLVSRPRPSCIEKPRTVAVLQGSLSSTLVRRSFTSVRVFLGDQPRRAIPSSVDLQSISDDREILTPATSLFHLLGAVLKSATISPKLPYRSTPVYVNNCVASIAALYSLYSSRLSAGKRYVTRN
eukprot:IDg8817t1